MLRLRLSSLALLAALPACIVPEGAQPQVTYAIDAATAYVHRGMVQNEEGVLQPSLVAALPTKDEGTILVRGWGNMDLSNDTGDAWLPDGHGGRFSQIDFNLLYQRALGDFVLTTGLVNYNLPNGTEFPFGERGSTTEVLLEGTTTLEELWNLQPVLALHYDVDEVEGLYVRGSVQRAFELDERSRAELEIGLGWMDEDQAFWNYAQSPRSSGFADFTVEGRVERTLDRHTTATATVGWSQIVDDEFSEWFDKIGIDDTQLWISLGLRWSY